MPANALLKAGTVIGVTLESLKSNQCPHCDDNSCSSAGPVSGGAGRLAVTDAGTAAESAGFESEEGAASSERTKRI